MKPLEQTFSYRAPSKAEMEALQAVLLYYGQEFGADHDHYFDSGEPKRPPHEWQHIWVYVKTLYDFFNARVTNSTPPLEYPTLKYAKAKAGEELYPDDQQKDI